MGIARSILPSQNQKIPPPRSTGVFDMSQIESMTTPSGDHVMIR